MSGPEKRAKKPNVSRVGIVHPDDYLAPNSYKEVLYVHCNGECDACKVKIDKFHKKREKPKADHSALWYCLAKNQTVGKGG